MSATLRHTVIQQRRHRREKRRKLRSQLAKAPGDRQAIEAKLEKTYATLTAKAQARR
jgi:Spy/CpxP family protein refolding chaperone